MTTSFHGMPHLVGVNGLARRIASRLAAGEIPQPMTSATLKRHFQADGMDYKDALRELELRNCIRLEKQRHKRGRPSINVRVHPNLIEAFKNLEQEQTS